eukprot:11224877-Ditylum_brightwellii.AAC.1
MEQFRKAQKVELTLKYPFNSRIHRVPSIIKGFVKAPFFIMPEGLCPKMYGILSFLFFGDYWDHIGMPVWEVNLLLKPFIK